MKKVILWKVLVHQQALADGSNYKLPLHFNDSNMKIRLFILSIIGVFASVNLYSQQLTVAFTYFDDLMTHTKVYSGDKEIGEVVSLTSNKNVDTVFAKINFKPGIKIPVGSRVYIQTYVIGESQIKIDFSNSLKYYNSGDILNGSHKSFDLPLKNKADSTKKY